MDPVTGAVLGVKPMIFLDEGKIHEVAGSGKRKWKVTRCPGNYYSCDCGAWQYQSSRSARFRSCSHIVKALGRDFEIARLNWEQSRPLEITPRKLSPSRQSSSQLGARSASIKRVIPADESDYTKLLQEASWSLTRGGSVPSELDFRGKTTVNGRALPKHWTPEGAIQMMLAETWKEDMDPTGWLMSEKLDGCRAYWTGERLVSRTNLDWKAPKWFLESVYDELPQGFPLDGELWRERDNFAELSGMCQRSDSEVWQTISYFVFDAPGLALPFEERMTCARRRVPDGELTPDEVLKGKFGGRIATLPVIECKGKQHLDQYFEAILQMGGEGVMLRRQHSPYERGRSSHCRKVKKWYDAEALVVGYTQGRGECRGTMGSIGLLMECGTIFTCVSGLSHAMRMSWHPPVGTLVRYRFNDVTRDGIPRFPIYEGVVHDRSRPKDAVVASTHIRMANRARLYGENASRAKRRKQQGQAITEEGKLVELLTSKP